MQYNDSEEHLVWNGIAADPADLDETTRDDLLFEKKSGFHLFHFPFFQWKTFFLFISCVSALFFHWIATSDLFHVPHEVEHSRQLFSQAREGYQAQELYWNMKLEQILNHVSVSDIAKQSQMLLHFQETSPELWIAYLVKCLRFSLDRLQHVSLSLKEHSNGSLMLIISKYESGIWPLRILLSIELEIQPNAYTEKSNIVRIRRGGQDIALGLSWAYFATELAPLKRLETAAIYNES